MAQSSGDRNLSRSGSFRKQLSPGTSLTIVLDFQVHFANYNDKEDVLRKAKLLKGAGIHISEDFSRKVREHRQELNKFMKEIRARDPARRMVLR